MNYQSGSGGGAAQAVQVVGAAAATGWAFHQYALLGAGIVAVLVAAVLVRAWFRRGRGVSAT